MNRQRQYQSGFTAIELLITLFIAAMFLGAGHQLYNAIIQDSGAARQRAKASNIAYDTLRRYANSTPSICVAKTEVNNVLISPSPEGLTNVRRTVTYSCPQPSLPGLTKVTASITYGSDSEEVIHAIYAAQ